MAEFDDLLDATRRVNTYKRAQRKGRMLSYLTGIPLEQEAARPSEVERASASADLLRALTEAETQVASVREAAQEGRYKSRKDLLEGLEAIHDKKAAIVEAALTQQGGVQQERARGLFGIQKVAVEKAFAYQTAPSMNATVSEKYAETAPGIADSFRAALEGNTSVGQGTLRELNGLLGSVGGDTPQRLAIVSQLAEDVGVDSDALMTALVDPGAVAGTPLESVFAATEQRAAQSGTARLLVGASEDYQRQQEAELPALLQSAEKASEELARIGVGSATIAAVSKDYNEFVNNVYLPALRGEPIDNEDVADAAEDAEEAIAQTLPSLSPRLRAAIEGQIEALGTETGTLTPEEMEQNLLGSQAFAGYMKARGFTEPGRAYKALKKEARKAGRATRAQAAAAKVADAVAGIAPTTTAPEERAPGEEAPEEAAAAPVKPPPVRTTAVAGAVPPAMGDTARPDMAEVRRQKAQENIRASLAAAGEFRTGRTAPKIEFPSLGVPRTMRPGMNILDKSAQKKPWETQ